MGRSKLFPPLTNQLPTKGNDNGNQQARISAAHLLRRGRQHRHLLHPLLRHQCGLLRFAPVPADLPLFAHGSRRHHLQLLRLAGMAQHQRAAGPARRCEDQAWAPARDGRGSRPWQRRR